MDKFQVSERLCLKKQCREIKETTQFNPRSPAPMNTHEHIQTHTYDKRLAKEYQNKSYYIKLYKGVLTL